MNPISIKFIAISFMASGAIIGLPSLAVLVLCVIHVIRSHSSAAASGSSFGENPDAILLLLKGIAETIGALARFAGELGQILLAVLAIMACGGLVLAVLLWFTGRGLDAQANWARGSAGILLVLVMLPSLVLALSLQNFARVPMVLVIVVCALGLHTLWVGYAPGTH